MKSAIESEPEPMYITLLKIMAKDDPLAPWRFLADNVEMLTQPSLSLMVHESRMKRFRDGEEYI